MEIKETENKGYRRMLVEIIVESFTKHYLFDAADNLKEDLQDQLNLNLKFETDVWDVENKNGQTFGKISFEDENGLIRVLDFTIVSSGVVL